MAGGQQSPEAVHGSRFLVGESRATSRSLLYSGVIGRELKRACADWQNEKIIKLTSPRAALQILIIIAELSPPKQSKMAV